MRGTICILVMALCIPLAIVPAGADDYILEIFGNANMDEDINEEDIAYVEGIIEGTNDETELADANYDGEIDEDDITQIELIIAGEEKELTFVDTIRSSSSLDGHEKDRIVTVKMPVNRIIITYFDPPQVLRALNAADTIVGVGSSTKDQSYLYPELSKLPSIGAENSPDFEEILNLQPDIILPGMGGYYNEEYLEKTPGVSVVYLPLTTWGNYVQNVRIIGYIVNNKDEAEAFLKWRENGLNKIREQVEMLHENEMPRVLLLSHLKPDGAYKVWDESNRWSVMCGIAGGKTIHPEELIGGVEVDPEWVMEQNPDIIFADVIGIKHGYITDSPSEMAAFREDLMNRPELAEVTAVKTGAVYLCSGDITRDATGGLILGLYMAKCFHPELFNDLDPKAIQQEYLTNFQGLDYDLSEHGVFLYPPLEEF